MTAIQITRVLCARYFFPVEIQLVAYFDSIGKRIHLIMSVNNNQEGFYMLLLSDVEAVVCI